MRRRRGGAAAATALVFAGLSAVTLASRGAPNDRTAAAYETASSGRTVLYAGIGLAIALCLALALWALWPGTEGSVRPAPRTRLLPYLVVAVILAVMAIAASRHEPGDDAARERSRVVSTPTAEETGDRDPVYERRASPTGSLAVAGIALAALALYTAAIRRRDAAVDDIAAAEDESPAAVAVDAALADEILGGSLDAAIAAVAGEPDPQRAVLLAYAVLEVHLSATAAARPPTATPHEWLRRIRSVMRDEPDVPAAATELTVRYERARFGAGATEADRVAAVDALGRLRTAAVVR